MVETGLIIAQVAFLVLLYLFVWLVVRSGARQLRDTEPARAAAPLRSPVVGPPEPVAAPVAEPVLAAGRDAPSPPPPVEARGPEPALEPVAPIEVGRVAVPPEPEPPGEGPEPPYPVGTGGDAPPEEVAEDEEAAEEEPATAPAARERRSRGDTGVLDLSEHLDPKLVVERSKVLGVGSEIDLSGGLTIGRSGANDVTIEDPFVSHMHARILRRGPYHYVEDLGSTNGTFLNDQRVEGGARLKVRDTLRLGETVLRYEE